MERSQMGEAEREGSKRYRNPPLRSWRRSGIILPAVFRAENEKEKEAENGLTRISAFFFTGSWKACFSI